MNQKIDKPITESVLDKVLDKKFKEFRIELKEEFRGEFTTKKEFEKGLQQVVQDISDFQETKWDEANEKFDRLFVTQDKILKILEDWQVENEVGTDQARRLRVDVDSHEKRLKTLEHKN